MQLCRPSFPLPDILRAAPLLLSPVPEEPGSVLPPSGQALNHSSCHRGCCQGSNYLPLAQKEVQWVGEPEQDILEASLWGM